MEYAIETEGLSKSFGDLDAVTDLNLTVETGEVFGFLGPNGAGKSTTIKLLLDEIRATTGTARLLGLDSHCDMVEVHRRVGYLPGELSLPDDLTGDQYLDFLQQLRTGVDAKLRADLVDRLGLDPTRLLGQLSTGNKQKVGLVQTFMHRPELVLLDEPTTGLDPLIQHDLHELISKLADEGTTIFLSSHALSEVDRIAHRVGIIREGRLVVVDSVSALKAQARRRIIIEFVDAPDTTPLTNLDGVIAVDTVDGAVIVTFEGEIDGVLRCALSLGTIASVRSPEADLEDVFLNFYRTNGATTGAQQ